MKKLFGSVFILAAAFGLIALPARAADFSADMLSNASGQSTTAHIAVKGQKMRMETPQMTMINRMDLGVSWILMPSEGMYMEHPIDRKAARSVSTEAVGNVTREALGPETVDGQPTQKFKVTYTDQTGTESMYQWLGANGLPLKTAALDGSWVTEFRNIQSVTLDDAQFEVPQGLAKFEMPNMQQMMKGMSGQLQGQTE